MINHNNPKPIALIPALTKMKLKPQKAIIDGIGYNHILYGLLKSGLSFLKRESPIICPKNWINILLDRVAAITKSKLNRLAMQVIDPTNRRE